MLSLGLYSFKGVSNPEVIGIIFFLSRQETQHEKINLKKKGEEKIGCQCSPMISLNPFENTFEEIFILRLVINKV